MDKKSFLKITAAGFTFYRARWSEFFKSGEIVCATEPGRWRLYSLRDEFKSKAAMQRAMDDLLANDPKAVTE